MESNRTGNPEVKKRKRRRWKIIIIILGALVCIRVAMPYVILYYANQKLASLGGYYGHIEDIDLRLYRGAYVVKDIYIVKVDKNDTSDFFSCPHIDLSVEWQAILKKKLVGEVEFEKPVVKYVMGKNIGQGKLESDTVSFIDLVDEFMPLRINRFTVNDGEIHYIDYAAKPIVDLPMTHVNIIGEGFTNESDTTLLPASLQLNATLHNGLFIVDARLDPLNDVPTFDMNSTLTNTDLTGFNNFFQAYANCDVEEGTIALYIELAAQDQEFAGYIMPVINDLKVLKLDKEEGSPPQIAWEAIVGGTSELLTNQYEDQLATKVPLSGRFDNPKIGVIAAIAALLRNAFIKALVPAFDNSIGIESVPSDPNKKNMKERLFDRKNVKENKE